MDVTPKPAVDGTTAGRSSRAVQSNTLYYIYASSAGQPPSENVHVLAGGSSTDMFVETLNDAKVITLSSKPSPTASLDSTDETNQWIQKLDSTATSSITADDSKNIESFEFQLTQPWSLTFSSASDVLLFTFGPPSGGGATSRIPPPGIDATGKMLTLGLDFERTADISGNKLKDLFTYAEAAGMADYIPSELLDLAVMLKNPGQGDPKRNALWYVPTSSKRIAMRLQFQVPSFGPLQDFLGGTLKGFTLKSTDIVFTKDMMLAATESGQKPFFQGSVTFSVECSVKGDGSTDPEVLMTAGIELSESSVSLTFMFESKDPLTGILKWLASLIGDDSLESLVDDILNKKENGAKVFPDFTMRRMTVSLDTKDPKRHKLSSFSFDIEVSANFGRGSSSNPVVFLISYNWDRITGGFGRLVGQLWNAKDLDPSGDQDLLPHKEKWTILQPVTPSPATSIDIASLIPGQTVNNIPDTLPSQITVAYITLTQNSLDIRCAVLANPPPPTSAPQPYLGEVTLVASFTWGSSSSFALDVFISASIEPSQDASEDAWPAMFQGSLSYDSTTNIWDLKASLTGLYASTLVEFFDQDSKAHVGPLINSIAISTLAVEYKYTGASSGKSTGSEFIITGDLLIAGLRLGLTFTYNRDGFTFWATLNQEDKSAKVGDVLVSALGSDIELPDFIYNTELVGSNQDAFRLDVVKKKTPAADAESFLFLAQLNIANVHISFAQMHNTTWAAKAPSKRLVKVAIDGFAGVELDLPLIGKLVQPLDELYFLWVQDPPQQGTAPGKGTGLTRLDLAELNNSLQDQILVKDKIKPELQHPTDLLVAAGSHFAVIIRSNTGVRSCLLDYEFMKPSSASSSKALKEGESADDGSSSAQAPYKKIAGPLSISNVGLKYKDKKLAIMFDATFQLGPLGFSLVGFSLGFGFTTLDQFPSVVPAIQGLTASFDQRPLSIAGVIRHGNDGGLDYYAGGLVIGWTPYQFEAAGFYGIVTPAGSSDGFRSVFVFAKLNGPLVTLEFAEINSICGGFGYNSSVRLPTVDQVYEFPLIASSGLSDTHNAMEVLEKLIDPGSGGWFKPLDKTYWLAIGMGVGAFQMLAIDAVVVVQFGSAIKLGIFAVATADVPSLASSFKLAHVELGISAVADFDYGTLKIDAQLSPRSYILDPNCHLTGGFGLYYWFDAPHADKSIVGQFVFTLGGYHQAFKVPVGYPNPPRLGISWNLGGGLTISGQAYFAITPKACMAGGRLHAAFSAGPLFAWFDAFADFLINYKPFYFNMQAGVSIGVGFSIDIWFIHIRISVEIGAQLYLWGPPVAGRVHVDFWIVAFDINFGDDVSRDEGISLQDFYLLVLQTGTNPSLAAARRGKLTAGGQADGEAEDGQRLLDAARPKNEGHNFLAQSGLLNPQDKPERDQNEPWVVRAGSFSFIVDCKMPINAVKNDPSKAPIITYDDVYSKPMKLSSPMKSTVTVVVQQDGTSKPDEGWQYDKYLRSLPRALWAKYDPSTDPRTSGNNISDLLNTDKGAVTLLAGVQITAPKPTMAPDPFPSYKVADADLQRLLSERPFPTIATADEAWTPAQPYTGDDVKKQYEAVYDAWTNPSLGTGDQGQPGFVGVLANSLKWAVAGEMKSVAGIPERLKKGFTNLYVAAPLLTK
ncbi:hypothetical protein TOPH_07323 [Tolypocladium ophioglossoides CBS 100239]|uniref:DUF6603 domain-containing protein n=1 Tax=Tolypocladium ophioglossoides (strain CBS 100239) TaxID=1163406 RepID=A0A0L0N1Y7_TOLOC|nr:hypothetical protein TOPH_07323 [Tolypocladium ophioglossoides CBS 100239]